MIIFLRVARVADPGREIEGGRKIMYPQPAENQPEKIIGKITNNYFIKSVVNSISKFVV